MESITFETRETDDGEVTIATVQDAGVTRAYERAADGSWAAGEEPLPLAVVEELESRWQASQTGDDAAAPSATVETTQAAAASAPPGDDSTAAAEPDEPAPASTSPTAAGDSGSGEARSGTSDW